MNERFYEWGNKRYSKENIIDNKASLYPRTFSRGIFCGLKTQTTLFVSDFDITHLMLGIAQEFAFNILLPLHENFYFFQAAMIVQLDKEHLLPRDYKDPQNSSPPELDEKPSVWRTIYSPQPFNLYEECRHQNKVFSKRYSGDCAPNTIYHPQYLYQIFINEYCPKRVELEGVCCLYQKKLTLPFSHTFENQLNMMSVFSEIMKFRDDLLDEKNTQFYIFPLSCSEKKYYKNLGVYIPPMHSGPIIFNSLKTFDFIPKVSIIDGFLDEIFATSGYSVIKSCLADYKKRKCNCIFTVSKERCNKKLYNLFDQVIEITKWRNHRCSSNNLVATIVKSNNMNLEDQRPSRLITPPGQIFWEVKPDKYAELIPFIKAGVKDGWSAKTLVEVIKREYNIKISLPTLAKIKRDAGIKTYKSSGKPRKRKKLL